MLSGATGHRRATAAIRRRPIERSSVPHGSPGFTRGRPRAVPQQRADILERRPAPRVTRSSTRERFKSSALAIYVTESGAGDDHIVQPACRRRVRLTRDCALAHQRFSGGIDLMDAANAACLRRIDWAMAESGARRVLAEIVVALPVPGWTNRPAHEPAPAVGTHVVEHLPHASRARNVHSIGADAIAFELNPAWQALVCSARTLGQSSSIRRLQLNHAR
jgi:hypothetical protein